MLLDLTSQDWTKSKIHLTLIHLSTEGSIQYAVKKYKWAAQGYRTEQHDKGHGASKSIEVGKSSKM